MKPVAFDYVRADSLETALDALAEYGDDAQLLAGGLSLMPMLNMRLARPGVVVDISRLSGNIIQHTGRIEVDLGVTQSALLKASRQRAFAPLLAAALPWVGHEQTRARGTVCGSVAHADPSAEIPLCLAMLDGRVHLRSRAHARVVPFANFVHGLLTIDCHADELIESVSFAVPAIGEGFAFKEFGRRHGDFAIVACAARVNGDVITLGIGGVADVPVVHQLKLADVNSIDEQLNTIAWGLGARSDVHADARLRRHLTRTLGRAVIDEAQAECQS